MVFQNYALFPHMSVEENLLFPLEVRRMPRDEARRRVGKVLEMVELSGFGGRRPAPALGRPASSGSPLPGRWSSSPTWC